MAEGKITAPEIIEAKQTVEDIAKIEAAFESLLKQMKLVVQESGNFKTQSQGNQILTNRVKLETEASAAIKERARLQNSLLRQEARNAQVRNKTAQSLAKERLETQLLNRENKETAILQSKIVGAYRKLNLERTKAATTLRDLLASEKATNAEIVKAQANFDKLDAKVRKADAAVRDSTKNVGNYKSAFSGVVGVVRGLVGAFGIIEGLRFGISFARDASALAREAKGVEFAFDRLGEAGVNAFNDIKRATRGTLSDLEIKTSINDFKNLGIELETSGVAFEFLSVRAAQTGREVSSLREDLVTGLGRGSVRILDNLGLSMAELNKLTKEQGLSIQQAFGVIAQREIEKAGNILDDAADNSQKWAASLENVQVQIGKVANNIPVFSSLSDVVNLLAFQYEQINFALKSNLGFFEKIAIITRSATFTGKETNAILIAEAKAREKVSQAVQEQINKYVSLNGTLAPLQKGVSEVVDSFDLTGPIRDVNFLNKEIEILNEKLLEVSSRDEAQAIQAKIKSLEDEKNALLGVDNARKETNRIIEGTIQYYQDLIKQEKEFQTNEALTAEAIQNSNFKVLEYEQSIQKLLGAREKLAKLDISSIGSTGDQQSAFEKITKPFADAGFDVSGDLDVSGALSELERFNEARRNGEEAYTQYLADQKDKQAEIVNNLFQEFESLYGLDASKFANLFDSKTNDVQDFANAAIELNNLLFNIAEENRQQDLENARVALEKTLDDETKSNEQKEAAQKKYDKEIAKIKLKSFKADQKAAILNIQIATAVAVLQAYAQLGPIGGTIAGIIISALGIAQTAVVASKKPPQFFKGTEYAPEGWAWTDEKGPELHTDKSGRIKDKGSNQGPRLKWLESGDKIFTAERTRNIFKEQEFNDKTLNRIIMKGHSERVQYKSRKEERSLLHEVSRLRNDVKNLSNRPINIDNTVRIEKEITQY